MSKPRKKKSLGIDLSTSVIVLRKEAITKKYDGGLQSFANRFNVRCNDDLCIINVQPGKELQELYIHLRLSGLFHDLDFVVYDFDEVVPNVPWLKENWTDQGLFVSYSQVPVVHDFVYQAFQIIGLDQSQFGPESLRIIKSDLERMREEHGQEKALELIKTSRAHLKAQAEYLSSLAD